jgi:hypothetical protein
MVKRRSGRKSGRKLRRRSSRKSGRRLSRKFGNDDEDYSECKDLEKYIKDKLKAIKVPNTEFDVRYRLAMEMYRTIFKCMKKSGYSNVIRFNKHIITQLDTYLKQLGVGLQDALEDVKKGITKYKVVKAEMAHMKNMYNIRKGDYSDAIGRGEICSVCLNKTNDLNSVKLNCGHIFHKSCISKWIKTKNTCPLCRTVITTKLEPNSDSNAETDEDYQNFMRNDTVHNVHNDDVHSVYDSDDDVYSEPDYDIV